MRASSDTGQGLSHAPLEKSSVLGEEDGVDPPSNPTDETRTALLRDERPWDGAALCGNGFG